MRIFFSSLLALGVLATCFGIWFIGYGDTARSWPSVEGRVANTTVRHHHARGSGGIDEAGRTYYPSIHYQWVVDGRSYVGSRYRLGESFGEFSLREDAQAAAARFPAGAPIDVHYNPQNHAEAVLDNSMSGSVFIPMGMGLFLIAFGAAGLRFLPQLRRGLDEHPDADLGIQD